MDQRFRKLKVTNRKWEHRLEEAKKIAEWRREKLGEEHFKTKEAEYWYGVECQHLYFDSEAEPLIDRAIGRLEKEEETERGKTLDFLYRISKQRRDREEVLRRVAKTIRKVAGWRHRHTYEAKMEMADAAWLNNITRGFG